MIEKGSCRSKSEKLFALALSLSLLLTGSATLKLNANAENSQEQETVSGQSQEESKNPSKSGSEVNAAESGAQGSASQTSNSVQESKAESTEQSAQSPEKGEVSKTETAPQNNLQAAEKEAAKPAQEPIKGEEETQKIEAHKAGQSSPKAEHETAAHASPPAHPASQPVRLFGRIEELCAGTGAKIPLKMQAMTPIRDASLDGKSQALAGKTSLQSYPIDYRGSWSGDLTVWNATFDRSYWEFDADEANKESQLLKRGTKGRCSVTFYQGANNRIELQPCQVVFTTTVNAADEMKQMMGGASPFGALFAGGSNPMIANMQVPYMYALHLGNLTSGTGVTGNQLNSQLMKNTLKELARGVLEQEVVTRDSDRNPRTGKVKTGYSESVLRFTRLDANRLYLQAASVSYRNDGKFQNKVILYGTLEKGAAPAAYPNPYGMQSNPYGGMMQGGAGAGSGANALQQQMQQMQKLLQQMGGR